MHIARRQWVLWLFSLFVIIIPVLIYFVRTFFEWSHFSLADGRIGIRHYAQEWGDLRLNQSVEGRSLSIGKKKFSSGIGTHGYSKIRVSLQPGFQIFTGGCGVNDEVGDKGTIRCKILNKKEILFESPVMRGGDEAARFTLGITGVPQLILVVENAGDGNAFNHADWVELELK